MRGIITQTVEQASAQGLTFTGEQVAAEVVRRHPELADMIADAEGPCPLCGAEGQSLVEAADPLPPNPGAGAGELLLYNESQLP
jgi:hypothetical protein